jgi:hypothetical protein
VSAVALGADTRSFESIWGRRLRNKVWYCNIQDRVSEFMLDRNIPLSLCRSVEFIKHRPDICRLNGSRCKDRTRKWYSTGAQVLAFILGRGLRSVRHCFCQDRDGSRKPGLTVRDSLEHLFDDLNGDGVNGVIKSSSRSETILRGALLLYGTGQYSDARDLAAVLSSSSVLKKALETLAGHYLKLEGFLLDT